ncbi:MAG: tripartite tricarboxylate transporter substrate-binding protein [Burkholderiales bacterium]
MIQKTIARAVAAGVCGLAIAAAGPAIGAYPEKPVRLIVPFSTGGGTDIQARLLSQKMREDLRQQVLVDNRTGAGGLIGAQITVESPADGYTVLFTTATIAVNVTLQKEQMKFNPLKDLDPVVWVSSAPLVLVTHPSVPAKSVKDLAALSLRVPKGLNMGGNTPGSTSHLSAEMFKQFAKARGETILYKGGGPATLGVATGEIDMLFATAPSAMPHIKAKRLNALAVTTGKPASALPGLPTMNSIYPGFTSDNWYVMFMPKGTPKEAISRINASVKKALGAKEVSSFYAKQGLDPVGGSPEEVAELLKREIPKYAKVITEGKIRLR